MGTVRYTVGGWRDDGKPGRRKKGLFGGRAGTCTRGSRETSNDVIARWPCPAIPNAFERGVEKNAVRDARLIRTNNVPTSIARAFCPSIVARDFWLVSNNAKSDRRHNSRWRQLWPGLTDVWRGPAYSITRLIKPIDQKPNGVKTQSYSVRKVCSWFQLSIRFRATLLLRMSLCHGTRVHTRWNIDVRTFRSKYSEIRNISLSFDLRDYRAVNTSRVRVGSSRRRDEMK